MCIVARVIIYLNRNDFVSHIHELCDGGYYTHKSPRAVIPRKNTYVYTICTGVTDIKYYICSLIYYTGLKTHNLYNRLLFDLLLILYEFVQMGVDTKNLGRHQPDRHHHIIARPEKRLLNVPSVRIIICPKSISNVGNYNCTIQINQNRKTGISKHMLVKYNAIYHPCYNHKKCSL